MPLQQQQAGLSRLVVAALRSSTQGSLTPVPPPQQAKAWLSRQAVATANAAQLPLLQGCLHQLRQDLRLHQVECRYLP